jgi:hypothetical protein
MVEMMVVHRMKVEIAGRIEGRANLVMTFYLVGRQDGCTDGRTGGSR